MQSNCGACRLDLSTTRARALVRGLQARQGHKTGCRGLSASTAFQRQSHLHCNPTSGQSARAATVASVACHRAMPPGMQLLNNRGRVIIELHGTPWRSEGTRCVSCRPRIRRRRTCRRVRIEWSARDRGVPCSPARRSRGQHKGHTISCIYLAKSHTGGSGEALRRE